MAPASSSDFPFYPSCAVLAALTLWCPQLSPQSHELYGPQVLVGVGEVDASLGILH